MRIAGYRKCEVIATFCRLSFILNLSQLPLLHIVFMLIFSLLESFPHVFSPLIFTLLQHFVALCRRSCVSIRVALPVEPAVCTLPDLDTIVEGAFSPTMVFVSEFQTGESQIIGQIYILIRRLSIHSNVLRR